MKSVDVNPVTTVWGGVGQFSLRKAGDRGVSPRKMPQNSRKLFFHGADR